MIMFRGHPDLEHLRYMINTIIINIINNNIILFYKNVFIEKNLGKTFFSVCVFILFLPFYSILFHFEHKEMKFRKKNKTKKFTFLQRKQNVSE